MIRIYTGRNIALVENPQPVGNWPVMQFPRKPVRCKPATLTAALANPSVALAVAGPVPHPATFRFADAAPEALYQGRTVQVPFGLRVSCPMPITCQDMPALKGKRHLVFRCSKKEVSGVDASGRPAMLKNDPPFRYWSIVQHVRIATSTYGFAMLISKFWCAMFTYRSMPLPTSSITFASSYLCPETLYRRLCSVFVCAKDRAKAGVAANVLRIKWLAAMQTNIVRCGKLRLHDENSFRCATPEGVSAPFGHLLALIIARLFGGVKMAQFSPAASAPAPVARW